MGATGTYYNVDDYVSWKRKQGSNFRSPPRANFLAAANHVRKLLDGKKLNWAAMGGLAMLCLGSRREMPDMHIIYEDRDFSRIRGKLESDPRAKLPQTMNPLFPSKILLGTGPMYKDAGCVDNVEVEIDLIPPGSHGSPPNDVLRKNQVLLRLNLDGKMSNFKGLNILYLVKTSLHYCKSQDLVWDPKEDILFLCQNYGKELEATRSKLDIKELEKMFFSTLFYSRLSSKDQRSCSLSLLGKELLISPPPTMAITPPPNTHFQPPALPGNARPPLNASKSTPQLHSSQQASAAYLSPHLPGKAKASPRPAPSTQTQAQSPLASGPQHSVVLANTAPRDSRSRYRSTSAQQTPGHGRSASADTHHASSAPPQQMNMDYRPHPQSSIGSTSGRGPVHGVSPQNMASGQPPAPITAATLGHMPKKSMPNLRSSLATTGPVPVYGHSTPTVGTKGPAAPATNAHLPAYGYTTATVLPSNRKHMQGSSNGAPHTNASVARPQFLSNGVQGTEEQHYSRSETTETLQGGGLRLVGPQGLYPSSLKPAQPSKPSHPTGPSHLQQSNMNIGPVSPPSASEQRNFPVELPANAYSDVSPLQSPENNARELSATKPTEPQYQILSQANFQDSSRSMQPHQQTTMIAELPAGPMPLSTQSSQFPSRPTHPRTHSEPISGLPTSLMAGRPASYRHSPSNSINHPSPPLQPQAAHTTHIPTNANRYTQYYTSPHSTPPLTSAYKAYSGPVSSSPPTNAVQQTAPIQQQILPNNQEISGSVHTAYQYEQGNRTGGLQPPIQRATGYEDFAHGPYTPVVSNEDLYAARRY